MKKIIIVALAVTGMMFFCGSVYAGLNESDCQKITHTSPSSTTNETAPTYTWEEDEHATWYKLWVGSPNGDRIFVQWYEASDICSDGNCSVTPDLDLTSGSYEWYIKSWNDNSKVWSDGMAFTVQGNDAPPSKVTHTSPLGSTQDSTPIFTWTEDPVSTWYKLWVGYNSTDKIFAQWYEASNICSDGTCSVSIETELMDDDYEWYIKSWNEDGKIWSDGMNFSFSQSTIVTIEKIESIDSTGGKIEITNSNSPILETSIEIPSNALNTDVNIEIGIEQAALPENLSGTPNGEPVYFGPEGTNFSKNVYVTIPYNESLLPPGASEEDIMVYCWDGANWLPTENNTVDIINNVVSFETSHFSVFQPMSIGTSYSKGLKFLQRMDQHQETWTTISAPFSYSQQTHTAILDLNPDLNEHDDDEIAKIEALAGVGKYQEFIDRVTSIGDILKGLSSDNKKEWLNEFHIIYETIKILTPLEDDPLIIVSEAVLTSLFPSIFTSWGVGGMFSISCFIVESSLKAIYQEDSGISV